MDRLIQSFEQLTGHSRRSSMLSQVKSSSSTRASVLPSLKTFPTSLDDVVRALQDANPLNLILGAIALYILATLIMPDSVSRRTPTLAQARSPKYHAGNSYSFLPEEHPPVAEYKKYSPRTLAIHDGSGMKKTTAQKRQDNDSGKILLAIEGRVFDVTKGANFYGPGGPYGNFAGRDASRGMAKQSFDQEMLTPLDQPLDKLEDLTPMEINAMREWISHFSAKYTIVGELVNEGEQDDK